VDVIDDVCLTDYSVILPIFFGNKQTMVIMMSNVCPRCLLLLLCGGGAALGGCLGSCCLWTAYVVIGWSTCDLLEIIIV
jgi:hypothetical protein